MATLSCAVPAEQAAACWHALDRHARAVYADGDARTVTQIMVDTLVERVTGLSATAPVPASVSVVMSDLTLLGVENRPAQLSKVGSIPGSVARRLAMSDRAWVRRLYTDPVDATVQLVDTRRRRFDQGLRELILARDQVCRTPGCGSSIRDVDHLDEWAAGGATTASNGRGRCKRCHQARHHDGVVVHGSQPRWSPAPRFDIGHGAYERWRTPIGRVLASLPPPALGLGTTTREQNSVRRQALSDLTSGDRSHHRVLGPHIDARLLRSRSTQASHPPSTASSMERAVRDLIPVAG